MLKKFGPNQFSRFDVYWIQTFRQAKYVYRWRTKKKLLVKIIGNGVVFCLYLKDLLNVNLSINPLQKINVC